MNGVNSFPEFTPVLLHHLRGAFGGVEDVLLDQLLLSPVEAAPELQKVVCPSESFVDSILCDSFRCERGQGV